MSAVIFRLLERLAAVRLPRAERADTLVVRSTSFGDFTVVLPFLAQCALEAGIPPDLLALSRFGAVADAFLKDERQLRVTVDMTRPGTVLRDALVARRRLAGRRYRRVIYLGHSSEEVAARAQKLGLVRLIAGMSSHVVGFGAGAHVRTRAELERNAAAGLAPNQALLPFIATGTTPAIGRAGVLEMLRFSAAERANVQALVARLRAPGLPVAGFFCGSRLERKRWPVERFVEAIAGVAERGVTIALLGADEDRAVSERIRAALPGRRIEVIAGATSLRESVLLYG